MNDGSEAHKLKSPNPGDEPDEDAPFTVAHVSAVLLNKYMGENMVIKMEFKDADEFFGIRDADKSVIL